MGGGEGVAVGEGDGAGVGEEVCVGSGAHRFDILVTDMVMPEMSDADLAEAILPKLPEVKVLFMSGYTQHAIVQKGLLTAGQRFLSTPFVPETLLKKLDDLFDATQPGSVGAARRV